MKARAWPMPLLLGMLTTLGLLCALLGDGLWDALSWLMLGAVLAILARRCLQRRAS